MIWHAATDVHRTAMLTKRKKYVTDKIRRPTCKLRDAINLIKKHVNGKFLLENYSLSARFKVTAANYGKYLINKLALK